MTCLLRDDSSRDICGGERKRETQAIENREQANASSSSSSSSAAAAAEGSVVTVRHSSVPSVGCMCGKSTLRPLLRRKCQEAVERRRDAVNFARRKIFVYVPRDSMRDNC
jgi:hypothetical protein